MKQVKIIFALLLVGLWSIGQTVTPNPGPYQNISTKYQYTWQKWSGGIWNLGKLVQVDSAQFSGVVYVPMAPSGDSSNLAASTRWAKENISPGVPGQPTPAWQFLGNYSPSDPTSGRLGFRDSFPLNFITDDEIRMIIPDDGIKRSAGLANKVLMIDTVTKKVYYADMGAGSGIQSVVAGSNIAVDNTDPLNPVVSSTGGGGRAVLGEYGLINDSATTGLYKLSVDSTELVPYSPRSAWHVFGNHTSGAANPTFGKLNVNSIDATGTPGSGNFLRGDGSWTALTGLDTSFVSVVALGLSSTIPSNKGLRAINSTASTATIFQNSPPLTIGGTSWNSTNSTSHSNVWNIYARGYGANIGSGIAPTRLSFNDGLFNVLDIYKGFGNYSYSMAPAGTSGGGIVVESQLTGGSATVYGHNQLTFNMAGSVDLDIRYAANGVRTPNGLSVGANSAPGTGSIFTVFNTTKGSIPAPSMTTTQKNAIATPPAGLRVYDNTLKQPNYYDATTWQAQVGMTFGTAAPATTPTAVGNFFLDTSNKKLYTATGTASSADWTILN